jgi:predicted nucleic acid-binding protein
LARYAAVLDACALVPIALADTLLRVAERELYRPMWSSRIVAEASAAIVEVHPDMLAEQVAKRFAAMEDAFEDTAVGGWEHLEASVTLPDPDDRHVVAVALQGRADGIVTANIADYPADVLRPYTSRPSTRTSSCSTSSTSLPGPSSTSFVSKQPTPTAPPSRRSTSSRGPPGLASPSTSKRCRGPEPGRAQVDGHRAGQRRRRAVPNQTSARSHWAGSGGDRDNGAHSCRLCGRRGRSRCRGHGARSSSRPSSSRLSAERRRRASAAGDSRALDIGGGISSGFPTVASRPGARLSSP